MIAKGFLMGEQNVWCEDEFTPAGDNHQNIACHAQVSCGFSVFACVNQLFIRAFLFMLVRLLVSFGQLFLFGKQFLQAKHAQ